MLRGPIRAVARFLYWITGTGIIYALLQKSGPTKRHPRRPGYSYHNLYNSSVLGGYAARNRSDRFPRLTGWKIVPP